MNTLKWLVAILALSAGCNRSVDLKVNGHSSEYMTAKILKTDDSWKVLVDLPLGVWNARLQNDPTLVRINSLGPRPIAEWTISNDRMHQDRPFVLELRGPKDDQPLVVMELRPQYPGQKFIEGVLKVVYQVIRPGVRF